MALMHIIFTTSAKLGTITKAKGNMIFVQDTKEIYVDFNSTSRVQVGLDNIPFPLSLPANGGNADTVDGKNASDFIEYIGVVEDLFTVNKTCICTYNKNTLNTPYKEGLTNSSGGLCIINCENGTRFVDYLVMPSGDKKYFAANSCDGVISQDGAWRKINDGGNADTVDGKHASDFATSTHTHDNRYYTESEINAKFATSTHTHDNRYYTESEIDTKFANFKSSSIDVRTSDPTNPAVGYMWITTN